MSELIDITGLRYGRLTVLRPAPNRGTFTYWHCRCSCGVELIVRGNNLKTNNTRSCGCLMHETVKRLHVKHGHTSGGKYSPAYHSWASMIARCYNPKHKRFKYYGGRRIMICKRWRHSFENFLADMGEKPTGLTLDRCNNDGNYEPTNCRWATWSEQNKNRRKFKRQH